MLTDAQLKDWKRATDGATPGPWEVANVSGWLVMAGPLKENVPGLVRGGRGTLAEMDEDFGEDEQEANALFFAVARTAMPALLAEVERLRTPTGDVGRAGFEAFSRQRVSDGLDGGQPWESFERNAPRVCDAWRAAGHAERVVAYALASQFITDRETWVSHDGRDVLAGQLRALGQPPKDSAERLARIAALLREGGALSVEVLADTDAPEEQRTAAEAIRKGVLKAEGWGDSPVKDSIRCWDVRRQHGPPGDDVPPSAEALNGAQAATGTALEMTRLAARRSSSAPLGRALGALETAQEQLAAALKLDPSVTERSTWMSSRSADTLAEDEKTPTDPTASLKDGGS